MAGESKEVCSNEELIWRFKEKLNQHRDEVMIATMLKRFTNYVRIPDDDEKKLEKSLEKLKKSFKEVDRHKGKAFLNGIFNDLPRTQRVHYGILYQDELSGKAGDINTDPASKFSENLATLCGKKDVSLSAITELLKEHGQHLTDGEDLEHIEDAILNYGENNLCDLKAVIELVNQIRQLDTENGGIYLSELMSTFNMWCGWCKEKDPNSAQTLTHYLKSVNDYIAYVAISVLESSDISSEDSASRQTAASSSPPSLSTNVPVAGSSNAVRLAPQRLFANTSNPTTDGQLDELQYCARWR